MSLAEGGEAIAAAEPAAEGDAAPAAEGESAAAAGDEAATDAGESKDPEPSEQPTQDGKVQQEGSSITRRCEKTPKLDSWSVQPYCIKCRRVMLTQMASLCLCMLLMCHMN